MFGNKREMTAKVTIHGGKWKLADIEPEIFACRQIPWLKERWRPSAALVHKKGGVVSLYTGQKFDPNKITLANDGWNHDHCEICWFALHDSDKEEENTGWTDGHHAWLCSECYEQFIAGKNKESQPAAGGTGLDDSESQKSEITDKKDPADPQH